MDLIKHFFTCLEEKYLNNSCCKKYRGKMYRYNFTEEGRKWMKLPKDSIEEYSRFRGYKEAVLKLLSQSEQPLSPGEVSGMTGIKKESVDHIMKLYLYAGYLSRLRTIL